jgi:hypothetical protein
MERRPLRHLLQPIGSERERDRRRQAAPLHRGWTRGQLWPQRSQRQEGMDRAGGSDRHTRGPQDQGGRAGLCTTRDAAAQLACVDFPRGVAYRTPAARLSRAHRSSDSRPATRPGLRQLRSRCGRGFRAVDRLCADSRQLWPGAQSRCGGR